MEKNMETTIMGFGFRFVIAWNARTRLGDQYQSSSDPALPRMLAK